MYFSWQRYIRILYALFLPDGALFVDNLGESPNSGLMLSNILLAITDILRAIVTEAYIGYWSGLSTNSELDNISRSR